MAFNKAPVQDTYSSERVSLFREITLRDGGSSGKDEDYLNVFTEIVKQSKAGDQRRFIMKRAGSAQAIASVAATVVRGMHFASDKNKLFYCVGRNVYVYNFTLSSSTTLTNVFVTTTGTVGFVEFLYDDGSSKMVASDGSATSGLVTIDDSNVVVTSADADIPLHDPNIVFLDGYLFLVKDATSLIYNSVLNSPLTTTGNPGTGDSIIAPEQEPDLVIRLAKINNYLLAFGSTSIEYFWDAANAAPDSPMQKNDTPIKINTFLGGFATHGNSIYYIGADANGQPDVFVLKDFKLESIGTPSISRYLSSTASTMASWKGSIVSIQGHVFYVINAGSTKSWAIDVETGLVTRFAYQAQAIIDIASSTNLFNTNSTRTYFSLGTDSAIYRFDDSLFQDAGTNYSCSITTESNDFGTLNRKSMHRLSIIGDTPTAATNISIQWSDDDYTTFSTARLVNLKQDLVCVRQLGSFRQRIFKFTYSDNYPLRIQDIEVDINKGTS